MLNKLNFEINTLKQDQKILKGSFNEKTIRDINESKITIEQMS